MKQIKYTYQHKPLRQAKSRIPISNKRLFVIAGVLVAFISFNLIRLFGENYKLDVWLANVASNAAKEEEKNKQLRDELEYVSTMNYHLKKAKDYLNLKEPNEQVVDIKSDKSKETSGEKNPEAEKTPIVPKPNWLEWADVFFSKDPYFVQ